MTRTTRKPIYRVTEQARHRVELLISVGRSNEHIADVLGISVALLRRYFADQLKHSLVRKEAEILQRNHRAQPHGCVAVDRPICWIDGAYREVVQ